MFVNIFIQYLYIKILTKKFFIYKSQLFTVMCQERKVSKRTHIECK